MIKKVKIEQLKPGMFISDMNAGFTDIPFLGNGLKLQTEGIISKISAFGIKELYIDTDKGDDVADAPTKKEAQNDLELDINKMVERAPAMAPRVPMKEEIGKAKRVHKEAKKLVNDIMADARLGKQVETEKVDNMVGQMVESVFRNPDALLSLGKIRAADEYTFQHSVSVCVLLVSFCKAVGVDKETTAKVGTGAMLHDIGKMQVPQEILNKPGKLTDDEFDQMKDHVVQSRKILKETDGISPDAVEVAGQHHERFDGSGYPDGLKGDEIGKFGQMAAIVDVYDAITSNRCYHKGMDSSEALKKIVEWSKFHFNKDLVEKYIDSVGIYPIGTLVRHKNGLLGVVTEQGAGKLVHPIVKLVYNTKKGRAIFPAKEVNLQRYARTDDSYEILGVEEAEKYKIIPTDFLDLP